MTITKRPRIFGAITIASLGIWLLASPTQAAEPLASPTKVSGSVVLEMSSSLVQQMFKAGLFIYGSSSVSVVMGDGGSLSADFPLAGRSSATPTTLIRVDSETGGISFYNGPAVATAGLTSLVVRRTGSAGVVNGRILGPFSQDSAQFDQTMPVFAMSVARAKTSSTGWTMTANLSLTEQGAAAFDTLLNTTVFHAGDQFGSLNADVRSG